MHIAVSRMENVDALQAVFLRQPFGKIQHFADFPPRDGAVHAIRIGRKAGGGGEDGFTTRPDSGTFDFVARHFQAGRAGAGQDVPYFTDFRFNLFGHAVGFAQQQCFGFAVETGTQVVVHGAGGRTVHHFQSGRNDAFGNNIGHRPPCFAHIGKRGLDDLRGLRLGQKFQYDFGNGGKHTFAADKQRQQIQARRIICFAAQFDDAAVHQYGADFQYVVGGQAVFQTVQAAGVLRNVAAYGAGKLAGRVGGVEKAVWRGGIGNGLVAHAGFHRGGARLRVDFQNAVKPRHGQQKPVGRGRAAAGQTRARTAHGNGYPQPRTGLQNGLHLRFGFRQGDGQRRAGENGQRVAFVGFQFVFRRQQGHAVQRAAQDFLQHGALFGIEGGLRGGFLHGGLRSGKTSGQYSPLADACKTASGLCRPAVIFSDGPN